MSDHKDNDNGNDNDDDDGDDDDDAKSLDEEKAAPTNTIAVFDAETDTSEFVSGGSQADGFISRCATSAGQWIAYARRPESLVQPKVMYLLVWGGLGSVMPFTPLFLRKGKGLTFTQIGTIGLISPLSKFLGSPLITAIADRTGQHFRLIVVVAIMAIALRFSLLVTEGFVPILLTVIAGEFIGAGVNPILESGVFAVLPVRVCVCVRACVCLCLCLCVSV